MCIVFRACIGRGMLLYHRLYLWVFSGPLGRTWDIAVPRFFIFINVLHGAGEDIKVFKTMKKITFLLLLCILTSNIVFAEDKTISMTVTVGVPFSINPCEDYGGYYNNEYWQNTFTDEQGNANVYYSLSDNTACTVSSAKNSWRYGSTERIFYIYTLTATKTGTFTFKTRCYGYQNYTHNQSVGGYLTYTINAVDVSSISIPENLSLTVGDSYTITPVIIPSNATPVLSWYSSNPQVATVEDGKITTLDAGTTTITCMANNGTTATCELTVKPMMNYLRSNDFAAGAGGHVALPILMKNDINVAGFQFDLVLPDGVTVAMKNGNVDANVTARSTTHTLTGSRLSSGATRFTAFSLTNALITGTDGAVMNVRIDVDKDMPLGEYDVQLTNVQLTQKEGADLSTVYAPDVTFKLTVGSIQTGDVNADGIVNVTDAIGIISHILEDTPTWFTESVADVNGDNQINVTDVIAVIDIILSESSAKARVAQ